MSVVVFPSGWLLRSDIELSAADIAMFNRVCCSKVHIRVITGLLVCITTSCSKSINSIGPFDCNWFGELGYSISSGHDSGMIHIEVGSDRSIEGYGELWGRSGSSSAKMFELEIKGMLNPNGSLKVRYEMSWVNPVYNLRELFPQEGRDVRNGRIEGYLNPALNYGMGVCLTNKEELAFLYWIVHRQECTIR